MKYCLWILISYFAVLYNALKIQQYLEKRSINKRSCASIYLNYKATPALYTGYLRFARDEETIFLFNLTVYDLNSNWKRKLLSNKKGLVLLLLHLSICNRSFWWKWKSTWYLVIISMVPPIPINIHICVSLCFTQLLKL